MDMKLVMSLLIAFTTAAQTGAQPLPGCLSKCGEVEEIPYPFGVGTQDVTGKNCFLEESFNLTCDGSKLWANTSQVSSISLQGQLELYMPVSRICYNESGGIVAYEHSTLVAAFTISSKENKFITIGCNTYGYLRCIKNGKTYSTGCLTRCPEIPSVENSGICSGIGCCQVDIPVGMKSIMVHAHSFYFDHSVWVFNNCSYSFVAKHRWFNFTADDLTNQRYSMTPLVVDWAVGNQICETAPNSQDYACSSHNTECVDTGTGYGYRCKCTDGYVGNPYHPDGCKDRNECEESKPCIGACYDLPGGKYSCSCPEGYEGDGRRNGTCCHPKSRSNTFLIIALIVSVSIIALLVGSFYLYWGLRKRKLTKLKEEIFRQNGGMLLQQQMGRNRGSASAMKIFTVEDLKKASNNFDERRILGQGGQGKVYKGVLEDSRVVAIKKSKISDQSQVELFINEVLVLSQINHRNVVKLLGCCLETEVPLLVYEFITNGSLSQHLHNQSQSFQLSWTTRLRVATETAGALAYLHSAASTPIIHRDIKTANILLDDRLIAKVSDFGASRLIPFNQTQITTPVQGTFGYLDPEYFHTSQLTEKSDVYSFGVVLAELLTSKKAISFDRPEEDRNLSVYFVSSINEGRLPQILDNHIINQANMEQVMGAANLANRCLMVKREDRPTMKEVAAELEELRIMEEHLCTLDVGSGIVHETDRASEVQTSG